MITCGSSRMSRWVIRSAISCMPARNPAGRQSARAQAHDPDHAHLAVTATDLGTAAGSDTHHHPPAEPPPVPPRGMGTHVLSAADNPAQPAQNPVRAVASVIAANRAACLAFLLSCPAALEPDGARDLARKRRKDQSSRLDRRLAEHGLQG